MSVNEAASCLGARVRELRHERGLTLKALGRSAGLSHPFLSQLERGLARPSVASVERIAEALDVPVGALWSAPRPEATQLVRAGEVLLYVVRGAVEIELDGTVHSLAAGDALKFDGAVRHRLRRRGPVTTRVLYVASG